MPWPRSPLPDKNLLADTKHRSVFKFLEAGILSGKFLPGSKLPTEQKLVSTLGVSRPTIARAMRDLQDLGLVERRAGAGSYVRRPAEKVNAKLILGLLIPELGCNDIFDPIGAELARRSQQLGVAVILGDVGNPQLHAREVSGRLDVSADDALGTADSFVDRGVAGVFFAPLSGSGRDRETNRKILSKLAQANIHVVLLDRDFTCFPARSPYDLVSVNHLVGQYLATQHLIEGGHRKIIYFQWPGITDSLQKRVAGMRVCLDDCSELRCQGEVVKGDPGDRRFVDSVIRDHRPDAIMCENDMVATHLLRTLGSLGLSVPGEVSVVGFNDTNIAEHVSTPLTTVCQPCRELGHAAVDVMNLRINDPEASPRTVLLEPRLIKRKSVRRDGQ